MTKPTHKEVKKPQITARFLADYMAAGHRERVRRSIIQGCKYRSLARMFQHDEAKAIISNFIASKNQNISELIEKSDALKARLADSDFERDLFDYNADYVSQFATVVPSLLFPDAEIRSAGRVPALPLNGVKVSLELHARFRRTTKTNKIRIGAAMLRYAKGKPLKPEIAEWQSAYLFGYLSTIELENGVEPERKLCVTIDAQSGNVYEAPSNSVSRFHEMEAACATIAEGWDNIKRPPGIILEED